MTPSHFADSVWEGYYYQDMVITNRGGRIDNLTTCTQAFAFHTFDETAQEPGLESPRYEGSQYTPPSRPKPNVPLNPVPRVYQELDKVITARWEGKGGEQDGNLTKKPPIKRMPGKVFCENRFCALELPTTEDKQLTAVLAYSEEDRTNDTQRQQLAISLSEEEDKLKRKENPTSGREGVLKIFSTVTEEVSVRVIVSYDKRKSRHRMIKYQGVIGR